MPEEEKQPKPTEPKISFADWEKLDIRIGTIKAVKQHPNADKLYVLLMDFGPGEQDRELVAGLKDYYKEDELVGKQAVIFMNLEPKIVRGIESEGMILAADDGTNPITILTVDRKINNNAKIR